MNFNSFEEILDFAIEREIQAVSFYQKLVDRETFPASKQTLAEFVEEERKAIGPLWSTITCGFRISNAVTTSWT